MNFRAVGFFCSGVHPRGQFKAIIDGMCIAEPRNRFGMTINDDVTGTSLPEGTAPYFAAAPLNASVVFLCGQPTYLEACQ